MKLKQLLMESSTMEQVFNQIKFLSSEIKSEKRYEEFFSDLDDSGLDDELINAVDSAFGGDITFTAIKKEIEKGLNKAYDKEGTEPSTALDLLLSTLKRFK